MTSLRLILASILLCGFAYVPAVFGFAKAIVPAKASGSLITGTDGKVIGSRLVAQAFTSDRYFHPRPSACDYNGQGACGSNLSPTNPEIAVRAKEIIAAHGATPDRPIPADLVTASGSGLDPDITLAAARFQVPRVARARNLPEPEVAKLLGDGPLVNVLEINIALDALKR